MFKNILKNAEFLQAYNDEIKPGMKYKDSRDTRKFLQEIIIEARKFRVIINENRKQPTTT